MAVRFIEAIANISDFERTDSGSLKVRAIARTPGILTYHDSKGARNELVSTEFLRKRDSKGSFLASQLGKLPVTLEHPPTLLRQDAALTALYKVGETEPKVEIYKDGAIEVILHVDSPEAIQAIESGEKRGVSLGYLCDIERVDGVYSGVRFDAKQCEPFEADHLAIVANPRAKGARIKDFVRTDERDDFAVAVYQAFDSLPKEAVSTTVNNYQPTRSNSMGIETAATVALSDLTTPTKADSLYQIEVGNKPFHVDSALYEAIKTERADSCKKEGMLKNKGKLKPKVKSEDYDDEEYNDEEYTDSADPRLTAQVVTVLDRCDAGSFDDVVASLDALLSRFDGANSLSDALREIDRLQGRLDALESADEDDDEDDDEDRQDSSDIADLLSRLDSKTAAEAIIKLDGEKFIAAHGHMLPTDFRFYGQTLVELQREALAHCKPNLTLRNDSAEAVDAAFEVVATDYSGYSANRVPARADSTRQLDEALALTSRQDMINAELPSGAQRVTGTPLQTPNPAIWNLSHS